MELLDLGAYRVARIEVEIRERLVEEANVRIAHSRAADRHAPPLRELQLIGPPVEQVRDAEKFRDALDALARCPHAALRAPSG